MIHVLSKGQEVLRNILPGQMVNLARYPRCLVPNQAWGSFYRPQIYERLSEPCKV